VATDDNGKPTAVPAWTPEADEDIALQRYAIRLMDLRKGIEDEVKRFQSVDGGA